MRHELAQVDQDSQPAVTHRVGDGAAHPDGRIAHDDVGELEHRLRDGVAELHHDAPLLAEDVEREGEEHAEDHDLQHVAFRHRLDHRVGKDVDEEVLPGLRRRDLALRRLRRQHHARAGAGQVHHGEADGDGDRGHHLEVDEGAHRHAAHHLEVAGARDAGNQGGEDERRDQHLDQAEEDHAEGPEHGGVLRAGDVAHRDSEDEPDHDLARERQLLHPPCPSRRASCAGRERGSP